jgi:hypothetical protein
MKQYAVKTGGDAAPTGVLCQSVVLRDDHVTFYGVEGHPDGMRVALTRGWYIHEVHAPKAELIESKIQIVTH